MHGELKPGQRVITEDAARQLSVSLIPVREELQLLQAEHLVITTPHTGTIVAPISPSTIALAMRVRVNGETWGEDTTEHMQHTFADMIAYASQAQTLYPGEVFGSGTAARGSGLELDRWLKEGDIVELEIEGIGVLRNRIGYKGESQWHSS